MQLQTSDTFEHGSSLQFRIRREMRNTKTHIFSEKLSCSKRQAIGWTMNTWTLPYQLQKKKNFISYGHLCRGQQVEHQGSLVPQSTSLIRDFGIQNTSYMFKTPRVHEGADKNNLEHMQLHNSNQIATQSPEVPHSLTERDLCLRGDLLTLEPALLDLLSAGEHSTDLSRGRGDGDLSRR